MSPIRRHFAPWLDPRGRGEDIRPSRYKQRLDEVDIRLSQPIRDLGVLLLSEIPDRDSKLVYFTGIDKARFRRAVTPGNRAESP